MLYFAKGSVSEELSTEEMEGALEQVFQSLGPKKKVLAIPPDITRLHSRAGEITNFAWRYYGKRLTDILPALGTHVPLTEIEIEKMFGDVPKELFRVHNWRKDLVTLGTVPADFVARVSEGRVEYDWPAQVNTLLVEGGFDLILSPGQVVPHEVIGMANHNKNVFVGTGGQEGINKSHFLGAVYGMERIMGRKKTPVRDVLNYASTHFAKGLPILYVLTVIGRRPDGKLALRGLYIGDDDECYERAADLSAQVNITMLEKPAHKMVVYLDPTEYRSTWLGNKSIYRTRMAIADEGELVVLAPGLREFGEDKTIDALIRRYGYRGTPYVLSQTESNKELKENLSAAAHLIHGSSEGRFSVTYCPGHLSREEVEGVGFRYLPLEEALKKYDPRHFQEGWNELPSGERVYFISNPAVGLWAYRKRFENN